MCFCSDVEGNLFCRSELKKIGSGGFESSIPGNGVELKLLVSLDGLVLDAVRDEQAAGCGVCISGRPCRTVHASWCSMKLSTLQRQGINIVFFTKEAMKTSIYKLITNKKLK